MDMSLILTALGTLGIGGAIGGVGVALVKRGPEKMTATAAFQQALNSATTAYSEATQTLITQQNARIEEQAALVRELDDRHKKDRQEVHDLRNEVQKQQQSERDCQDRAAKCEARCTELEARLSGLERSMS